MHDPRHADRTVPIPPAVGEGLQTALGLSERPETLREWGLSMGEIVDRDDLDVGLQTLCTTDDSPHRARFDGTTQHFVCVQDAVIVPYVTDDVDEVEIVTESPIRGERIEVDVSPEGVETRPPEAVMSMGVAADVTPPAPDEGGPAAAYGKICPYGHAFTDEAAYEAWAETVDAETMVAPLTDALGLAAAIGEAVR